jgi:GAF domain-containing protein/HAMP domain-containing protein
MISWLRRFNILSWPIWVKLLVGFSVAVALLTAPTALILRGGLYELGMQNARLFVAENGAQQVLQISNAIATSRTALNNFTDDNDFQQSMYNLLLTSAGVKTNPPYTPVTPQEVAMLFREELLNPAAATFDYVRLLDRNGRVIAQSSLISEGVLASDESESVAFQSAANAWLQGQSRIVVVSTGRTGEAMIEAVNIIEWRDGSILGYLVARINSDRAVINNLPLQATSIDLPGFSFLTSRQGYLFAIPDNVTEAQAAQEQQPVLRALNGQRGVETYTDDNGLVQIAFYAPISGTPLVLITQTPAEAAYTQAVTFINVRIFVIGLGTLVLIAAFVLIFNQIITPPLRRLQVATQAMLSGDYQVAVPDAGRGDEIGALSASFVAMRDQVRSLVQEQENRIIARARDFSATQEISRVAATQRDLQTLMNSVVQLIVDRFPNIYHAQIFLLNEDRSYAILRASTGEPGRRLLERGHRLAVGSVSVIGQVTDQGRIIVARDTAASPVHRRNEFLPDTRAELAIPLRIGTSGSSSVVVIGALDVQSKLSNTFTEDQINVLQTMADLVAVAIENARLYEESLERAAQIEENNRQATLRVWQEFMRDQRATTLIREAGAVSASQNGSSPLRQLAMKEGRLVTGRPTERNTIPVAVPIQLRGQTVGSVEWELPMLGFSEEKLELARELASRLAYSLDNARLFQESQRAIERERLVNTIAAKLTAQTSIDAILQTAVREVGQALGAPQVSIRLGAEAENGSAVTTNGHHD